MARASQTAAPGTMLLWMFLALLVALFVGIPVFTPFPAGSDQQHVVEHRATASSLASVASGLFSCFGLGLFFLDMLLSRGATGANPDRARQARERAERLLEQLTRLEQAGNLAQYGVENSARGSVAGTAVAAAGAGVSATGAVLHRVLSWLTLGCKFIMDATGLGKTAGGAIRSLVGKVAALEGNNDSGAAQDFCARVAQIMGVGLVTVFGAGMSCEDFSVMSSAMRFGAVLISITFLALSYFSAPDQKWSEVGRGTVSSIKQHTVSNSVALAATLALRVVACSFGSAE
jgi:hypothetical protein